MGCAGEWEGLRSRVVGVRQHMNFGGVSGLAGGTFPLDCFFLGFECGLWIEMVIALCLSAVSNRIAK